MATHLLDSFSAFCYTVKTSLAHHQVTYDFFLMSPCPPFAPSPQGTGLQRPRFLSVEFDGPGFGSGYLHLCDLDKLPNLSEHIPLTQDGGKDLQDIGDTLSLIADTDVKDCLVRFLVSVDSLDFMKVATTGCLASRDVHSTGHVLNVLSECC